MRVRERLHPIALKPKRDRSLIERLLMAMHARRYAREMATRYGAAVPITAEIGPGLRLLHEFHGIFIAKRARIGANVTIGQHVTIGASYKADQSSLKTRAFPLIGNGVFIGANATIIGRCVIGDGARIGAGVTLVDATIDSGEVVIDKTAFSLTKGRPVHS